MGGSTHAPQVEIRFLTEAFFSLQTEEEQCRWEGIIEPAEESDLGLKGLWYEHGIQQSVTETAQTWHHTEPPVERTLIFLVRPQSVVVNNLITTIPYFEDEYRLVLARRGDLGSTDRAVQPIRQSEKKST